MSSASGCDVVLENATVLTMDAGFATYASSGIAVRGDTIVAVGADALTCEAAERIDCRGRVVMRPPPLNNPIVEMFARTTFFRCSLDDFD